MSVSNDRADSPSEGVDVTDGEVRYELVGSVAVITIDRPARANSLSEHIRSGLWQAWRTFEADNAARVAILTGAGDRVFCSGADLKEMATSAAGEPPVDWAPVIGENIEISKPTIAAVNGGAFGGGFLQAQMCDLIVASTNARFGITEARWGRGSPWALPLFGTMPTRRIMELLLTAQPMDAEAAHHSGFVNRVVAPSDLMPSALSLAEAIAANAPLSLRAAKQMATIASTSPTRDDATARTKLAYRAVYESADAQLGPRSFREGKAPEWTGT